MAQSLEGGGGFVGEEGVTWEGCVLPGLCPVAESVLPLTGTWPLSKNWVFPRGKMGCLADRNLHLFNPFLSAQRPDPLGGRVGGDPTL